MSSKTIIYKNKLIIASGEDPESAKIISIKGRKFSVFKWDVANCFKLKLGGHDVQFPPFEYDFSKFYIQPYQHQLETVKFLSHNPRAFCWNEAGTGKTACCIWAYDYLRKHGILKKVLIISPTSTLRDAWGKGLFRLLTSYQHEILIGTSAKRRQLLSKGYDIYVINHDGIKVIDMELSKWGPDLVIIDEHTAFKNVRTDRWVSLQKVCVKAKAIWALSGTPMTQSPLDIFGPARLLHPTRIGRSFGRFRELLMRQVSMYKWEPRSNFEETVHTLVKPVIRFSRQDCLDLPDVVVVDISVELSTKQTMAFNKLKREAYLLIDSGEITAANEGVLRNKLLQCCDGFIYDALKNIISLDPKNRLEAVLDVISESSRGVLIFASYKSCIYELEKVIKKSFSVKCVTGDVASHDRQRYFDGLQDGSLKVIVAHPATMSHGVTLTNADTLIWYSVTSNSEWYDQANSRIQRIGQKNKMRIVRLISTPFEQAVLKRLEEKQSMQGILLDLVEHK